MTAILQYRRPGCLLAAGLFCALALALAFLPPPLLAGLVPVSQEILHAGFCAAGVGLMAAIPVRLRLVAPGIFLAGLGVETLQPVVGRGFEGADIVLNAVGIAAGTAAVLGLRLIRHRLTHAARHP